MYVIYAILTSEIDALSNILEEEEKLSYPTGQKPILVGEYTIITGTPPLVLQSLITEELTFSPDKSGCLVEYKTWKESLNLPVLANE